MEVALARGDTTSAGRWADNAVSVAPGLHLATALVTRARVATARSELDQGECDAREAVSRAASLGGKRIISDALETLATALAVRAGANQEAVRLCGAAHALRIRFGQVRLKIYDADHEASMAALRDALGDEAFKQAWAEGEALSIDEAIAYAQRGRGDGSDRRRAGRH